MPNINGTTNTLVTTPNVLKMRSFRKSSATSSSDQNNAASIANNTNNSNAGSANVNSSTSHHVTSRRSWKDQPNIGKYKLIRTLGRGNFAKVKLAQHVSTGREVAVKVIDKTQLNQASLKKLFREVKVMKMLNHPNIVHLYEVIESERHVYLVMEYAENGEVFDYLVANGRMKEKEARVKFRQIISAVEYCHQKKIVHRDLKAENLFLDENFNIKLGDFGFSNIFDGSRKLDTFCGSPPYAAPELFQGRKYDGPEVDVWSLGVILYTLVSGSLPFDAQHLKDLQERVLRGKYRIPFYMTTDCEALLRKLLVLNPAKRTTLRNIMSDKWLNMGFEDCILKPYVEPPLDYNDPVRLAIMQQMGYRIEDVRDALENERFNNFTAIYLLLADPKTKLTLPALNVNRPSEEHLNQLSNDSSILMNNSNTKNHLGDQAVHVAEKSIDNGKSLLEDSSQLNGTRQHPKASWLKQSSSAGPTSTRTDVHSEDNKHQQLPGIRVVDLRERNANNFDYSGNAVDENGEFSELTITDPMAVRRTNTFNVSDKVRPAGSDSSSPSPNCPLSRAPPMSNIPNFLSSHNENASSGERLPSRINAHMVSTHRYNDDAQQASEDEDTLKPNKPKLNQARPFRDENPTFPHKRRPRNADELLKTVETNQVVDMLDPEERHKFYRNGPGRSTITAGGPYRKGVKDSVSSSCTDSPTSTLNASSSSTLDSHAALQSNKPKNQPALPDTISKALINPSESTRSKDKFNVKSPVNVVSNTRNSLLQWSVRHRVNPVQEEGRMLTDQNVNASQERKSLNSADSVEYHRMNPNNDKPQCKSAIPYKPNQSGPRNFLRSLANKIGRSFRCGRFKTNQATRANISPNTKQPSSPIAVKTADQYSPHPHLSLSPSSQQRDLFITPEHQSQIACSSQNYSGIDSSVHVCSKSPSNPGPWITMVPGTQQSQQQSTTTVNTTNSTNKPRTLTDHHNKNTTLADNFSTPQKSDDTTNLMTENFYTHEDPLVSSRLTTSFVRLKSLTATTNGDQLIHQMKNRYWKPRRLHFVSRLPIMDTNPQELLINLVKLLKTHEIPYEYMSSYRLRCSIINDNNGNEINKFLKLNQITHETQGDPELDNLLKLDPVIKWDMEIFQLAKPTIYGIRFKRLHANHALFKNLVQTFIQLFTSSASLTS